jgi:Zn-dependent alcohol dehydrogenase
MDVKAIVAREPTITPTWRLEDVTVNPPGEGEVLVKVTPTGICRTDVLLSSIPTGNPIGVAYPKILGHEGLSPFHRKAFRRTNKQPGAGIIQAVGKT